MTDAPIVLAQKAPAPPVPVLPPPQNRAPAKPAPLPPPAPPTQAGVGVPGQSGHVIDGLPFNGFDIVVIACITVLVALIALIPKSLIARHLVARRAPPSAANAVGWTAWFFVVFATVTVLVGTLGRLWTVVVFSAPAGLISVVLLLATIHLFARALKTRR